MCREKMEKQKILIADDEQGIRQLLRDYFEMQGYQVAEAANGMETLGKLSQEPDIIILDVGMPVQIGRASCRERV